MKNTVKIRLIRIIEVVVICAAMFWAASRSVDAKTPSEPLIGGKTANAFLYDLKQQLTVIYAPPSQNAFNASKSALEAYMTETTADRICGRYSDATGVVSDVTRLEYGKGEWQDDGLPKVYAEIHTQYDGLMYYTHIIFLFNEDNVIYDYVVF
ncbi:hypothetical protein AGMMS49975_21370 [Clostridia bacterium]|nr:hypothetical protein AGMMS49975_21370 [Clostridia bacterium]